MTRAVVIAAALALVAASAQSSPVVHALAVWAATVAGLLAVVTGLRRHRPSGFAWKALTVAISANAIATAISFAPVLAGGDQLAQPSLPDAAWLGGELLVAAALAYALTRRERPLMVALDLASIVVGVGLVIGVMLVEPALASGNAALDKRILQVAYTACDVALIAGIVRVLLAPRGRPAALWLLCAAAACLVVPDLAWTSALIDGATTPGWLADLGWSVFPLFVGAAALHPSMVRLGAVEVRTDAELHPTGPLLLGLTTLIAPLLLGANAFFVGIPDIDDSLGDSVALIAAGSLLAVLVVARFLLLIRRAGGRADRSEERYQSLVEEVPAVVVLFDLRADGLEPVPIYVSPQAEAILGLRPEDWLADPSCFATRVNADDMAMLKQRLDDRLAGGPGKHPEFRFVRPDGEEIWLRDVSGVVADGPNGLFLHAMLVDITEARRAEADRVRMESELRLAQKLEAVGQLAAGIAHEINTPTQFVGDTIHFLQDAFGDLLELVDAYTAVCAAAETGPVGPELLDRVREAEELADLEYLRERIPGAFERATDGVSRVATIVRAMRDFAHPPTLEKTPVDVVAALRDTLVMAANAYRYVARVETEFEELPAIMANGGELNQVFLNLVVNAAHAIEGAVGEAGGIGTIRLQARTEDDHVLVSISDTGGGIPDAVAARVFDPFFTTKEVGRGTGQGLAIARTMVVERHGGTLTFDTEPGEGTTFHVRLPIAVPA